MTMLKNFDEMQKYGKDHIDLTMRAWGQVSKGVQAIAAETADYSKRSFEEGSAAMEKLLGAKSLEKAIEIQTAYAKTAYERFVAQATKMGELYADLAKESYKPFETLVGRSTVVK
jgi:phasin family protein